MSARWRALGWLVTLAVFVALPKVASTVTTNKFSIVLYLSVAVLSVVLLTGLNHQVSLGQSAFFGIGAYATAILVGTHGWSYWLAIPLGAAVAFVVGVIVGLPALRLKGHYLALVTLGLAVVFPQILNRFTSVTGGTSGLSVNRRLVAPSWSGLADNQWSYYVLLAIGVVMFVLVRNLALSRIGRALRASAHETAARSSGVDVAFYRVMTFGVSAAVAAVAGGMFSIHNQFVGSSDFGLLKSVDLLAAMVVGGGTLVAGAIIGGLFLQFAPEYTQKLGIDPMLTPVVYAALLLFCVYCFRDGIAGGAVRLKSVITTRLRRARPPDRRWTTPPSVRVTEEITGSH
jgi:branched-chain amino acid transport system permease protein